MNAVSLFVQEGPDASLSWLLWIVFGFFLLMVLVGWWVSRNRGSQPMVQHEAQVVHEMHPVHEKPADDLVTLEGIGPKVAKVLNEAGIVTFTDLATADLERVQGVLNAAGLQYMNPAGWIEQAKLAAAGDLDGLAKLQDELKGGRRG